MSLLWRSWGGSVTGPLHQQMQLPNQDAWLAKHFVWGDVVVAADGLGSRLHADIGAKMACRAVCEAAKIYQKNRAAPLSELTRLIHALWLILIAPYLARDCATTCLFALRINDELIVGQLGDGMIILSTDQVERHVLMTDHKGESFSNITLALSEVYQAEQWVVSRQPVEHYQAVLLCTDGISDDLREGQHVPFAHALIDQYRELPKQTIRLDLLRWLNAWPVPFHSDDKTVVCLCRHGVSRA